MHYKPTSPANSTAAGHALQDLPYVSVAAMVGVLALGWGMVSTGVPLWIAGHTTAPLWTSALIVALNALTILCCQVQVTERVTTTISGARAARWAGTALALSCLGFASSANQTGPQVLILILAAAGLHVTGELLFIAAAWRLSVDLMPSGAPGEYQGVFAIGQATAQMVSPALMASVVVASESAGWLLLAVVFAASVLPATPITDWALRTRPVKPVAPCPRTSTASTS